MNRKTHNLQTQQVHLWIGKIDAEIILEEAQILFLNNGVSVFFNVTQCCSLSLSFLTSLRTRKICKLGIGNGYFEVGQGESHSMMKIEIFFVDKRNWSSLMRQVSRVKGLQVFIEASINAVYKVLFEACA